MKKKYLFILTFAIFAILMFLSTGEVKAAVVCNDTNLYVRTTIERWNDNNKDLVFEKIDDWGGSGSNSWYTKTVWLADNASGDPTSATKKVQITVDMLDANNKITLDDARFNTFNNGSTVYLVEKYQININDFDEETAVNNYLGNWGNTSDYLPCSDRLDFSFDYSAGGIAGDIRDNSFSNYNPESSNELLIIAGYDDTTVSTDRDLIINYSFSNGSSKTTQKSQGTINLPVYGIEADFTARGNVVKPGYFGGDNIGFGDRYIEPSSSIARLTGLVENSYDDDFGFTDLLNGTYTDRGYLYGFDGDTDGCYYDPQSFSLTLSDQISERNGNTYVRTLSGSYERNGSAPNGVFFNILPFAIAGMVAIVGIVLLKKISIKE